MPSAYRDPPIINAPPLLTALALSLVAAHVLRVVSPDAVEYIMINLGAVYPDRFWAWAGVLSPDQRADAYSSGLFALLPFVLTAFIHGDWIHLVLNAAMLVGVGKPVYSNMRTLYRGSAVNWAFLILFFSAVAGGSIAHLLANYPAGQPAIGASGGISGILAALILINHGPRTRLISRQFLVVTALFVAANVALAVVGPALLGAAIAWQAHIGGFLAGALVFRWMTART